MKKLAWYTATFCLLLVATSWMIPSPSVGQSIGLSASALGGAARGTEGNIINAAVGNATSAAFTLPTGYKTITGRITGAGAVAQVITIYGGTSSGMVAATSDVVCTITLSGTSGAAGTAYSCPPFIAPFLYYIAVTSGSSGTPTTILTASY